MGERQVGHVDEVVCHLGGGGVPIQNRDEYRRQAAITPFRERGKWRDRRFGCQPNQTVTLLDPGRHRTTRLDRNGALRCLGGNPHTTAGTVESVAVVRAFECPIDDGAKA
jgi:hypothetical protein